MFMSVTTDIMNSKYAMNVRFKKYVGLIKILLITQATKTILRHPLSINLLWFLPLVVSGAKNLPLVPLFQAWRFHILLPHSHNRLFFVLPFFASRLLF